MAIHFGRILAVTTEANLIGKLTAIVLGVTSPISSNNGTITTILIQPTFCSENINNKMEVIFTAEAILTSSLPHNIEIIRRLGSSSIA